MLSRRGLLSGIAAIASVAALPVLAQSVPIFHVTGTNNAATDTPALQSAISSAQSTGYGIVWTHGACATNATLTITGNITFCGDGPDNTWLLPTSSSFDVIFFNPPGATEAQGVNPLRGQRATIKLEGFSIQFPSVQNTGKVGIRVQAQTGGVTQPVIRDVSIYNAPSGMIVVDTVGGLIQNCKIENFNAIGIMLQSPTYPDAGGMVIKDCAITNYQGWNQTTGVASGTGILWKSGGALKVQGCAFAALYDGFKASLDGSSTQCTIHGCSFDTTTDTSIWFERAIAGVTFGFVNIAGNTFATPTALYIATDTQWLSDVSFIGNTINGASATSASQVYVDAVDGVTIAYNEMRSNSASPTAINIGAHTLGGVVGPNTKRGTFAANPAFPASIVQISPT